ncbi:hypothetical protein WICMUC_002724 [Wickerhamomyces mucosus]|uniref:ER transporter 6TM N-terminal domain-containing protein n=1 Tax=Wickerhamomyces mucosus TaxID=1378264 RepID=A0A9P8PPY4_9ASCO|nr:hypothetical protein WICMUC_002724 [Wickerhamomyces mucosus]
MSPEFESIIQYLNKKKPSRLLTQRIFKSTVNSTIALILCLNPNTLKVLGGEPAMLPLISVIIHPGRRFGTMIEAVFFCSTGLLLGNAYAIFSKFIAQKILGDLSILDDQEQLIQNYHNYKTALSFLVVMQIIMLFFHGWMRVITHKFFAIVFPLFLVVHFAFSDPIYIDAGTTFRNYTVPFFLGIAISIACNLLIFPEFGSSFLGKSITQSLNALHYTLDSTIQFFINPSGSSTDYLENSIPLSQLIKQKAEVRAKLNSTEAVLQECIYEISFSFLSPIQLKPIIQISKAQMNYINALINSSQLEFTILLKNENSKLLRQFLPRTEALVFKLHRTLSQSIYIIKLAISYSYDVKLSEVSKSKNLVNDDIDLDNIDFDQELVKLKQAVSKFDRAFKKEMSEITDSSEFKDYLSPNDEIFILSSFLMNLKQTSQLISQMMRQSQTIFEYRKSQEKHGILGQRLWFSILTSWGQLKDWFHSQDPLINSSNLNFIEQPSIQKRFKENEPLEDEVFKHLQRRQSLDPLFNSWLKFYNSHGDHFRFGFQITAGLTLATFPMFVPESRKWFVDIRGTWIGFVCILVLEPQLGGTFFVFFLRFVGVISGAAWGYLSYVSAINQTNPYLEVFVSVIGAIPGFYFFLGTPYVKAAIIMIISIYVVMLSAVIPSELGSSISENFGKRCLAMIYGGAVALLCQLIFFPMKARDALIAEVAFASNSIAKLTLLYATGLDGEKSLTMPEKRFQKFTELSELVKSSLSKAEVFRKEAKKEPRLKGSFKDITDAFKEIIFILHEIVDRLDNIIFLRKEYGSAIIEDFNEEVYPYRRQMSASMNNSLKVFQLALLTKDPLPQYLPSVRIAHQRLILKIKETVSERYKISSHNFDDFENSEDSDQEITLIFDGRKDSRVNALLKEKFLSWNATSSCVEEIIEYIEELLELGKILFGVNEFKYGFLSRPLYKDYVEKTQKKFNELLLADTTPSTNANLDDVLDEHNEDEGILSHYNPVGIFDDNEKDSQKSLDSHISQAFRKRVYSIGSWINSEDFKRMNSFGDQEFEEDEDIDLPLSLKRIVSKKVNQE